ncbi:hypothetical protein WN944_019556 [Citrus x changshan-huyou]|uniref:SWIB domain-containing protein n=4 Tax=Citrus TaxID=2706 RepID=A0ACB8LCF4_CITSI|nr:upstream activation factor subunit UAF30 [Citrus x clementina]XP_006484753.1 upstream activation factor subunit UAF30 [Citrus sinensis]GAY43142.1 hypothetical protein CUMW_072240 [Citrus unshiu]ESR50579.1 hypothetical protein CICLE_v10033040mg [Citrus x clementina]KAH9706603.1 SWIB domain-containing protein [Citrus sinensis]KAH9771098.1 SWIB domain-containing protein [Citrus sinensis]KDO49411.1 hypothetical protein CISIN_1g032632mg [Citrus sinensis]
MSSAAARVFNGCRALLAPAKSSAAASSAASTKAKSKTTKKPRAKSPVKRGAPTRPTGISKVSPVSPALAKFLGAPEASRSDAVRQIWAHVKTHNLQNPENKREILCDEKLKAIFEGKNAVGFLEIGKLLSPHFVKTA